MTLPLISSQTPAARLRVVVWLLVVLVVPCWILHGDAEGEREGPRTNKATRPGVRSVTDETIDVAQAVADLRNAQPDYIGIGNSMLFTRLGRSPEAMDALTGRKFFFFHKSGSSSAIWYLVLKNIVAASGVSPKAVIFFVRDDELTAPLSDSESNDSPYLLSLRTAHEPVLEQLLGVGETSDDLGGRINRWGRGWFYFPEFRVSIARNVQNIAMDIGGGGAPKKAQRLTLGERFGLKHLRGDAASDKAAGGELASEFINSAMENTPLDAMLTVAEAHSLRLLFFRIKRRPDETGNVANDPSGIRDYTKRLASVITARGSLFFDETYDPAIKLSDYLDGDHIRPQRLSWYQHYFWERLRPVLEP